MQKNVAGENKALNEMKELYKDRNNYRRIAHNKPFDYLPSKSKKSDETINEFPADVLRQLYGIRWEIETSFRDLKYTVGILHFHLKKGGIYSPRNICTFDNVSLFRVDYLARSHRKERQKVCI